MSISERFGEGCKFIVSKILWIVFVPIVLDLASLFSWEKVYHTVYYPAQKVFMIKLGFIEAPPSVRFILEDFPTPLFKYDNSGVSGIINRTSLFNAALFITIILVVTFLHSGYLSIVSTSFQEKARIRDFFIKGNRKWHKFFFLDCITWIPMMLMVFNRSFIFIYFINVIFVYVRYSFVADEVSILENFRLGIAFFFNNLGLSIKMAIYFGLIFSLFSLVMFPLVNLGTIGIIIDIVICAYLGAATNKAVLEIYRDKGNTLDMESNV